MNLKKTLLYCFIFGVVDVTLQILFFGRTDTTLSAVTGLGFGFFGSLMGLFE